MRPNPGNLWAPSFYVTCRFPWPFSWVIFAIVSLQDIWQDQLVPPNVEILHFQWPKRLWVDPYYLEPFPNYNNNNKSRIKIQILIQIQSIFLSNSLHTYTSLRFCNLAIWSLRKSNLLCWACRSNSRSRLVRGIFVWCSRLEEISHKFSIENLKC